MKIGLVYDLRQEYLDMGYGLEETAEFDKEETIEAIESSIRKLGHATERVGNIFSLNKLLAQGHRWDMVFNIAEGLRGQGREAQVPALLDAFSIPYTFAGPVIMGLTLNKGLTKHIIRANGIKTADFAIMGPNCIKKGENNPEKFVFSDISLEEKIKAMGFPVFIKPIAEGTGKGISENSKAQSLGEIYAKCCEIWEKFQQPALLESYLPGREFTAGIVGSGENATVIGALEIIIDTDKAGCPDYSFDNKENYQGRVNYSLVPPSELMDKIADLSKKSWLALDCHDGGRIDLREDKMGELNFIEVNPLAGLNPVHSDLPILCYKLGKDYDWLIKQIVDSAIYRHSLK